MRKTHVSSGVFRMAANHDMLLVMKPVVRMERSGGVPWVEIEGEQDGENHAFNSSFSSDEA